MKNPVILLKNPSFFSSSTTTYSSKSVDLGDSVDLDSVDSDELQSKAKEMIDDCSKKELKKVLTLLIGIARKSFQEY